MNKNQRTTYIFAFIALLFVAANIFYTMRFYNGLNLTNNVLIGFNTDDPHGVSITKEREFISFENGIGFHLNIQNLPNPEGNKVSLAIPIKHLQPQTTYTVDLSYVLQSNSSLPYKIGSNANLSIESTAITMDSNYDTVTLNPVSHESVARVEFATNSEGVANIVFTFPIDDESDEFDITISSLIMRNFKEVRDDNVNDEQASEESIELYE